jgi:hypothetical protein
MAPETSAAGTFTATSKPNRSGTPVTCAVPVMTMPGTASAVSSVAATALPRPSG